ncbi:MAG: DUF4179 domain-containing protein, partial [Clostridia bacterium]|nr:DUF4179 domain-containing protein [Clostridia bacterium]
MKHDIFEHLTEKDLCAPRYTRKNARKINKIFLQATTVSRQRARPSRVLIAVAIIAASLALVTLVATAVGVKWNGFLAPFLNAPKPEWENRIGQTVTKNGIEMTLESVYLDNTIGSEAIAVLSLRDIEGDRLSDDIGMLNVDEFKLFGSTFPYYFQMYADPFYDEQTKTVTMAVSIPLKIEGDFFEKLDIGKEMSMRIDKIASNRILKEEQVQHDNYENQLITSDLLTFDFDIAAYAKPADKTITYNEWCEAIYGENYVTDKKEIFTEEYGAGAWTWGDDETIRLLSIGELALPIGGCDWAVISNIGTIDNQLHLQIKFIEPFDADSFTANNGLELVDNTSHVVCDSYIYEVGYGALKKFAG